MTFEPEGIVDAPVHFSAPYSVLEMHVSNFLHSFQHVFFSYFRQLGGCQLGAELIFRSLPDIHPLLQAQCQQPDRAKREGQRKRQKRRGAEVS